MTGRTDALRWQASALELKRTAERIMADRTPCPLTPDEFRAEAARQMDERTNG